ncbi:MAG: gamma carbonic anhydrase family protein [Xanthomonadales bacterium]|nr:gamma carbonic anhydrase family protein [Xanthomonadales bacterium]MCB1628631.1 gamma carbonic anhydrase family protein [Xanthomonadales bacterium]MCB1633502.1 gamma carbonic anhydrase family protein [Xanthomonadales bacterium]
MNLRSYQGQRPQLGQGCWIDPQATVIGDVVLGDEVSVWPQAVIRGDVNHIRIGARSNVQDAAVLHVTHDGPYTPGGRPLLIAEDVTIGHGAILHACTVGRACLIGMKAVILDGAVLEDECMIGAGAVVPPGKRVARGTLWLGNPARCARELRPEEIENLHYSAAHYVRLKNRYLVEPADPS